MRDGGLAHLTKSDLLKCFDKTSEKPSTDVTVKVFDGPAVVNFIQPTQSVNTIGEYVEKQLVLYLLQNLISLDVSVV